MNFPAADMGYEVFLFQIDIPAYMSKMFVGGMKANGVVLPTRRRWAMSPG